jgi:integrase
MRTSQSHIASLQPIKNTGNFVGRLVDMYLDKDVLPYLGRYPIAGIKPIIVSDVVERIERRGAFNVAQKTRQWLNAIFKYAIAKGMVHANPAEHLSRISAPRPPVQNQAHIDEADLSSLLRAVNAYIGSPLREGRFSSRFGLLIDPG